VPVVGGRVVVMLVLFLAVPVDVGAEVVAIVAILGNVSVVDVDRVPVLVATSAAIAESPTCSPMRSVRLAEMRAPRRRGMNYQSASTVSTVATGRRRG